MRVLEGRLVWSTLDRLLETALAKEAVQLHSPKRMMTAYYLAEICMVSKLISLEFTALEMRDAIIRLVQREEKKGEPWKADETVDSLERRLIRNHGSHVRDNSHVYEKYKEYLA